MSVLKLEKLKCRGSDKRCQFRFQCFRYNLRLLFSTISIRSFQISKFGFQVMSFFRNSRQSRVWFDIMIYSPVRWKYYSQKIVKVNDSFMCVFEGIQLGDLTHKVVVGLRNRRWKIRNKEKSSIFFAQMITFYSQKWWLFLYKNQHDNFDFTSPTKKSKIFPRYLFLIFHVYLGDSKIPVLRVEQGG